MKVKKVQFDLYFFLSTFLVFFLPCKTNAVVIEGMVRLFRGEGDFVDSVNGYNLDQTYSTTSTPNAGITFPNATPYGTQERQVMHFSKQGKKYGDGTGFESFDLQKPYLELWLTFIGFEKIEKVIADRTLFSPEEAEAKAMDVALKIANINSL